MERYLPQIKFIGENEQQTLFQKSVAILGLGALGSVAAELLTRAGIGHLILIDHDIVELSNLQRQSLYDESDINKMKAKAAFEKLEKINSEVTFTLSTAHITRDNTSLLKADIILDCTDNMETRFVINEFCKKNNLSWVHAAASGSIGVVLPVSDIYCFNCVYGHAKNGMTCNDAGILNTTAYTTASIQVTEAIKILLNKPHSHLIRFDLWNNTFDHVKVKQAPNCMVCKGITNGKESFTLSRCNTGVYSAKPNKSIAIDINKIKNAYETIRETPIAVFIKVHGVEVLVYNYGELVFKQFRDEEKIKKLAKEIYEVGSNH